MQYIKPLLANTAPIFLKEPDKVLQLLPKEAIYYFTQANIPRAMDAEKLKDIAGRYGLKGKVVPKVNLAIQMAQHNASEDDMIFIGGSIFMVSEIDSL